MAKPTKPKRLKKPTRIKKPVHRPAEKPKTTVPTLEQLQEEYPRQPDLADVALERLKEEILDGNVSHEMLWTIIKDKLSTVLAAKGKTKRKSQSKYPDGPRSKHVNRFAGMSAGEMVRERKKLLPPKKSVIPEDDEDDYLGKEFETDEEKGLKELNFDDD